MTWTRQELDLELESGRVVPFHRFMETALYGMDGGYYERDTAGPGRKGDFSTSVTAGPLFGRLLAMQLAQWVAQTGAIAVQWVEAGAHDGALAEDILDWVQQHRPGLWPQLRYLLVEPSPTRRRRQAVRLARFGDRVRWAHGWEELPPRSVRGAIFSNELLDAFPVRRLGWDASARTWFEWGVQRCEGRLQWARLELAAGTAEELLAEAGLEAPGALQRVLPAGFTLDLAPSAAAWWRAAAERLGAGKLLTFDYGLVTEEFWNPSRVQGTLRAYRAHRVTADVLGGVGDRDLTAHVNFSQLQRAGESAGLRTELFTSQEQFLTGVVSRAAAEGWAVDWSASERRQFATLAHPSQMGRTFRVLVQARG